MKKLLFLIPLFLSAESLNDLVSKIDNSLLLKIQKKEVLLQKTKLKEINAANYGKIDLSYTYSHLFDTPELKMDSPQPVAAENAGSSPLYPLVYQNINTTMNVGSKENYIGELTYSYPLFTGFEITDAVKIQKLNVIKSKLKLENLKRNLILKTAELYSGIYSLNKKINALKEAQKALKSAKEQALALYKEGLLNKSNADEIDAKYYEIEAELKQTIAQKEKLINLLSYVLNYKVKNVTSLPYITLKKPDFLNRPDVKVIITTLKISKNAVKLADSNFYPKIFFQVGIKKEAQNFTLSKNNYQNIDKSFVALSLKYNLFSGGADKAKREEAKLNVIKAELYFNDYLKKVKTDYKNDLLIINSLKSRLISAQKEIKARESFYKYIKAKFDEGLADVVDLNSAISKLAAAKAKKEAIKSEIFFYTLKADIDGGNYEE